MAMVEMVIILPVLLVLLFAIIEMGMMFVRWQTISNAAREGARTAILFRQDCDANIAAIETEVRDRVEAYAHAGNIPLDGSDNGVVQVCGLCSTTCPDPALSAQVSQVTVTYDFDFFVLPGLSGVSPSIELLGQSVMRKE